MSRAGKRALSSIGGLLGMAANGMGGALSRRTALQANPSLRIGTPQREVEESHVARPSRIGLDFPSGFRARVGDREGRPAMSKTGPRAHARSRRRNAEGVSPKRRRKARLKCDRSWKPAA